MGEDLAQIQRAQRPLSRIVSQLQRFPKHLDRGRTAPADLDRPKPQQQRDPLSRVLGQRLQVVQAQLVLDEAFAGRADRAGLRRDVEREREGGRARRREGARRGERNGGKARGRA